MNRHTLFMFGLILCIVASVMCSPSQWQDLMNQRKYVVTPFGYMPKGCVHHALESDLVTFRDNVLTIERINEKNEKEVILQTNSNCEFGEIKKRGLTEKPNSDVRPDGWAAYARYIAGIDFNFFGGYWTVPQEPQQEGLQTLFLFTGFQNQYSSSLSSQSAPVTSIIQPVLQWGNSEDGDEPYWAIASWFVGGEHAVYSDLKGPLNPGDLILGNMTLSTGTNWEIVTADLTLGLSSSLNVDTDVSEVDAFVTLEVYGIRTCKDYPNGSDTFWGLYLEANGKEIDAQWKPYTEVGCQESITITNSTSVTIKF